jgi:hypothetical protein
MPYACTLSRTRLDATPRPGVYETRWAQMRQPKRDYARWRGRPTSTCCRWTAWCGVWVATSWCAHRETRAVLGQHADLRRSPARGRARALGRRLRGGVRRRAARTPPVLFVDGRGAWCVALEGEDGGEVVGSCGVVLTGARGRFQAVDTAQAHRRRGICSRLVVQASQMSGAGRLVICADPDYHALGLYESFGFRRAERVAGVSATTPRALRISFRRPPATRSPHRRSRARRRRTAHAHTRAQPRR